MGHIFSKKAESKVNQQDRAILQLKTTRDKIRQYQKRSDDTLEKDRLLAKKLLQQNKKDRARLILRKKKFIEEQLKKTDGQLENIEQMIQDLEYAQIELKVIDSLKVGNESLKQINALMNIEDIEAILDETQDAIEKQQEIDALLSGNLSSVDEDSVKEELEALINDEIATKLPEAPSSEDMLEETLPEVPTHLPDKAPPKKTKIAVAVS